MTLVTLSNGANGTTGTNGTNGTNGIRDGHPTNGSTGTSNGTNGLHSNDSNSNPHHDDPNATQNPLPTLNGNSTQLQDGDPSSAIAIIGIFGRFPGDGTTPRRLWDMLREGKNALGPVPKSRFNVDGFYHPDGRTNNGRRR